MATYKDIDLTFDMHPIKKDVTITSDIQSIVRSLKNILLTNHYESPFNPSFGSNIRKLLFENVSPFTANFLEKEIRLVISNFEPRVKINNVFVDITPDQNKYKVIIEFTTVITSKPIKIDFLLKAIR